MFGRPRDPVFQYAPLPNGRSHTGDCIFHLWREALIVVLSVACISLTLANTLQPLDEQNRRSVQQYRLTSEETHWKQFLWNTKIYSSEDPEDEATINAAWERIVPAFGIISVDHQWAVQHNLPDTMSLPSNDTKGVYIIDAYHQIHCLTIIRKTLVEIAAGKPPTVAIQHSRHCFDSLLQYIVCGNSGDTLLYTWGRNQTGNNQLRNCVDWGSRRKWARMNTACYKDSDHPIPLNDHFGNCESHDDGIQT